MRLIDKIETDAQGLEDYESKILYGFKKSETVGKITYTNGKQTCYVYAQGQGYVIQLVQG